MTIIAIIPTLVAVVSAVLYLVVAKAEVKELARCAFFASFLVVMFGLAGHVVRFAAP